MRRLIYEEVNMKSWYQGPTGDGSPLAVLQNAFIGLALAAGSSLYVSPAHAVDTTAPNVSISAPKSGAVVSGTIAISATASDNVGVAGVQFKYNGFSLGEDTSSPYSVTTNTATAPNGTYTLTAIARDAAGNKTTSAPVTITVLNKAPASTPYTGTPIALPGTIEAENFDKGGEGVGYHDKAAGNAGGQYRTSENVDIIASTDSAGGGYVINNFETGEWLAYTVNVAAARSYDIEIRASTTFTNAAFHVELDGKPLIGSTAVPNTGSWSTFKWVGAKGVALPAGKHVLKIVSDQQYFNLNSIRVVTATASASGSARLLFKSGFEGATALLPPSAFFGTGAWQEIVGADSVSGFSWPINIWGGSATHFQMLADATVTPSTIGNYIVNEIQTVTGRNGTPTRALMSGMKQSGCCGTGSQGGNPAQDPFMLQPATEGGDLYISYWLKYQPDLGQLMGVGPVGTGGWNWRAVFEWKTAGDYRVIAQVKRDPYVNGGNLFWAIEGDNEANGGLPFQTFWQVNNTTVPVPVDQWFKFEVFWHRSSGSDGRVWMAANGQVIVDQHGPNKGVNNAPINRIMMPNLYSSTAYPIYQWIDDVQIFDGFPSDAAPH
jgi:hypothetical protein